MDNELTLRIGSDDAGNLIVENIEEYRAFVSRAEKEEREAEEYSIAHLPKEDRPIAKLQAQARNLQDGDDEKPEVLISLGTECWKRFMRLGDVSDIEMAIVNEEHAIQLTPDGHPDMPRYLNDLGVSLQSRFNHLGDLGDIEKAISYKERALALTPNGHRDHAINLNNVGNAYMRRFTRLGEIEDLSKAITHQERAVLLASDGDPCIPPFSMNLGNSLCLRFERLGDIGDLEKAILYMERAVQLMQDQQSDEPIRLYNLENPLARRRLGLGDIGDLEKAIIARRSGNAVVLHPNTPPGCLNNLALTLMKRFNRLGKIADLERVVMIWEHVVLLTPENHREKPLYWYSLGDALVSRFERLGEISDIENAIKCIEHALQFTSQGHPHKPGYLKSLGSAHTSRFKRLGELGDIDKAVRYKEHAILWTPGGHPSIPHYLSDLGDTLILRFERLGEIEDIEKAVRMHELALQLTPDGHPDKAAQFHNLGNSRETRFERFGEIGDIEKAITNREHALRLIPNDHPNKPTVLSTLGCSLQRRFIHLRQVEDIGEAILNQEKAVQLTPEGHPDRPAWMSNLGNSLQMRFDYLRETGDLDNAISNHRRAVVLTSDDHPVKSRYLNNLGLSLIRRFENSDDRDTLADAILTYSRSSNAIGPPSRQFRAAITWATLAHRFHDIETLMEAYTTAFSLLPRLSWLGRSIASRHHELLTASSLACDGAAAAISVGDLERAVEWLEEGRSVVWGQILRLRTPIEELSGVNADFALRLSQVAQGLEQGSDEEKVPLNDTKSIPEQMMEKYHRLAEEWESLVKELQRMKGFERFLHPKRFSELRKAANQAPVVLLNVSEYGCDALILETPSIPPHHVHLGDLTYEKAKNLRMELQHILSQQGVRNRHDDRHGELVIQENSNANDAFRQLLGELWKSVVEPVMAFLPCSQSSNDKELLHVRWCPTGPLAFLPIHAAGIYNSDGSSSISLTDIAVSSYTPTLNQLLTTANSNREFQSDFKLLVVAQPNAPGANPLPGTIAELACIERHASEASFRNLNGLDATTAEVLSGMEECSWVHLACHGIQDELDPMASGLLLQDGRLHLSKIIQKRLPHAEFAFLSACQTATGDGKRPEEAIHLAAGMLLAGYKGVIATMWSIRDDDGPFIADKVYAQLLKDGQPSGVHPAVALHKAVQELRKRSGSTFSSWVPFIHMGA